MSKRLYDCTTAVERLGWIKSRLEAGHTVSQNTLEIGGVVNPHGVIGGLRASGMRIEQIAIDCSPYHGRTGIREERLRAVQAAVLAANGKAVS